MDKGQMSESKIDTPVNGVVLIINKEATAFLLKLITI